MRADRRLMLVAACLALGLATHAALAWHLGPTRPPTELRAALESFPDRLGDWVGTETPGAAAFREQPPYAIDGMLWRDYRAASRAPVNLYLVWSRDGDDRNHHPEICIREVRGAGEDVLARGVVPIGGDPNRPVMRFRFLPGATPPITVYYWHYALDGDDAARQGWARRLHDRASRPPASLTAQLTVASAAEKDAEGDFLARIDQELRAGFLPAAARMACDRKPVILFGR